MGDGEAIENTRKMGIGETDETLSWEKIEVVSGPLKRACAQANASPTSKAGDDNEDDYENEIYRAGAT